MRKFILLISFLLFNFTAIADNKIVSTGMDLLHNCDAALKSSTNLEDALLKMPLFTSCYSYIDGFWESYLEQLKNVHNVKSPEEIADKTIRSKMFCVPGAIESVTTKQLILIVVNYLHRTPARLNMPQGDLVYAAFIQAFPCQ